MNEVQTQGSREVATYQPPPVQILRTDIIVPYLCLAQGMSDAVVARKVQMGDIFRSTTLEKLGDPDKPVEIVFLHYPRADWIIEQKEGERFQYRSQVPRNATNETQEWYFWADDEGNEVKAGTVGATEWRRVKRFLVFAILLGDLAAFEEELKKVELGELPDPNKAVSPVLVSFRSSSYHTGKEVGAMYTACQTFKTPIWKYKVKISCKLESNDDGSFYVWTLDRNKPAAVTKEQLETVKAWADLVNSSAVATLTADEGAENESYVNAQNAHSQPSSGAAAEAQAKAKAEVC